jgi:hypothetical protein
VEHVEVFSFYFCNIRVFVFKVFHIIMEVSLNLIVIIMKMIEDDNLSLNEKIEYLVFL